MHVQIKTPIPGAERLTMPDYHKHCRVLQLLTLAVVLGVIFSGCVYFNTFYNAKKRYQNGERARRKWEENQTDRNSRRKAQEDYLQAITKASAVIELYPGSKYVEDCLLLIGKAQYWREDYPGAILKFSELRSNFPDSRLIEESRLWEGRSYWKLGRYEDAQRVLRALAFEGRSEFSDQAAFVLLEVAGGIEDFNSVVKDGRELLSHVQTSDLKASIHLEIGKALLAMGRLEEAGETLGKIKKGSPIGVEFEARRAIGEILEKRGEFGAVRDHYAKMLKLKRLKKGFGADIQISLALVLYRMNRLDESYEISKGVTETYKKTPQSAKAYYQMGLIAQRQQKDSEEIKDLFDRAKHEYRRGEISKLADQRLKDFKELNRYQTKIASDSTDLESVFQMAELFRLRLDEPDSALVAYRTVAAKDTTGELAPKAGYAIGWIYAETKRDSASARATFESMLEDYPGTIYADAASDWLGDGDPGADPAQANFQKAETLRLTGGDPEIYIGIFERIVSEFPRSSYSVKSLFSTAWTYENVLDDAEKARVHYEIVAGKHARTLLGALAQKKVDALVAQTREDSIRAEAEAEVDSIRMAGQRDSLADGADVDSLTSPPLPETALKSVPQDPSKGSSKPRDVRAAKSRPPRVASTGPLVYPDSLKNNPQGARIMVKILVGKNGEIKRAEVLKGPKRFHDAALATIQRYRFIPGARKGEAEEMWTDQIVIFPPSRANSPN